MPIIIAKAVISTGRNRVKPACSAAAVGRSSFGHLLSRETYDQNAVCRRNAHAHDRPHQRRHTQSRVGDEQEPGNSGQCRRQCRDHDEGIKPRLEIHHDQKVVQHDGEHETQEQSCIGRPHGLHLAANYDSRSARQLATRESITLLMSRATPPKSRPCTGAEDVNHRCDIVVRHDRHAGSPLGGNQACHD